MLGREPGEITQLLGDWSRGNEEALARMIPLVYDELRHLAASYLRHERREHTLQATAIVHETYLRLLEQRRVDWRNRGQFFAIAARMMRRILVDYARSHRSAKRGGGVHSVPLAADPELPMERSGDLVALDEALEELAAVDPLAARVVDLRFFAGLTSAEISEILRTSERTVSRRWRVARAWLHHTLARKRCCGP